MKARGQLEGVSPLRVGSMLAAKHQVNHLGAPPHLELTAKGTVHLLAVVACRCPRLLSMARVALPEYLSPSLATAENCEARVSELRALLNCLWTTGGREVAGLSSAELFCTVWRSAGAPRSVDHQTTFGKSFDST